MCRNMKHFVTAILETTIACEYSRLISKYGPAFKAVNDDDKIACGCSHAAIATRLLVFLLHSTIVCCSGLRMFASILLTGVRKDQLFPV